MRLRMAISFLFELILKLPALPSETINNILAVFTFLTGLHDFLARLLTELIIKFMSRTRKL